MNDPLFSRPWWRQLLFRLFSGLVKSPSGQRAVVPANPRRILVLAPVKRGDYIVLSPLLAGLTRARPRAEIAVMVTHPCLDLAKVDTHVDRIILYHKLPKWFVSVWTLLRYHPDVVIMPKGHPATTESMVLLMTRAPFRIGLSHPYHDSLLTHPIEHDWVHEHRTEAFVRLLRPFGVDPTSVKRRLHIGRDTAAEEWAARILGAPPLGQPFIALNLSAGGNATREWTPDAWRTLIEHLTEYMPEVRFLVLGAGKERALCEQLAREFPQARTIATRSLLEASALVAHADLLITPDTGMVQAAAARDIPMVVLYNGHHEAYLQFGPQSVPHRAVLADRGNTVASLSPTEVSHEVMHLMSEIRNS